MLQVAHGRRHLHASALLLAAVASLEVADERRDEAGGVQACNRTSQQAAELRPSLRGGGLRGGGVWPAPGLLIHAATVRLGSASMSVYEYL